MTSTTPSPAATKLKKESETRSLLFLVPPACIILLAAGIFQIVAFNNDIIESLVAGSLATKTKLMANTELVLQEFSARLIWATTIFLYLATLPFAIWVSSKVMKNSLTRALA